jgi:hypothetical protein
MRAVLKNRTAKTRAAKAKTVAPRKSACTVCGKPATEMVDGEPSCAEHVELVYENQLEDYTLKYLGESQ